MDDTENHETWNQDDCDCSKIISIYIYLRAFFFKFYGQSGENNDLPFTNSSLILDKVAIMFKQNNESFSHALRYIMCSSRFRI